MVFDWLSVLLLFIKSLAHHCCFFSRNVSVNLPAVFSVSEHHFSSGAAQGGGGAGGGYCCLGECSCGPDLLGLPE